MTHREGLGADDFRQENLRGRIAVEHAVFGALLVVQYELHGDARVTGPTRMRHSAPISDQIARVVVQGRAPCPIQVSIAARSSSVIAVRLPSGMVRADSCCCTSGRCERN